MAKDYDKEDGVWRTIGGRKVFIRKGQNLADAMIESGKFKGQKNKPGMRESYRKEKEKDYKEQDELYEKYKNANDENVKDEANKYMKKVSNNNELYEDTYEKRAEKENRYAKVDAERGETEPLREQYREQQKMNETNEKIARHLDNVSRVAEEMGDKKLAEINKNASNYARSQIKNVDDYLNRDTSKDKLNYNANTKEDTLYGGIPNRDKVLNEKEKTTQGKNYRNALTKLNDKSIEDGTYDLDTGKKVDFGNEGYNVSFEQSSDNYSDSEYYDKIEECRKLCDGKVYGGKFGGSPEISFYTKDKATAMQIMEKYNQHSIYDNSIGDVIENANYNAETNKVNYQSTNETMNNAIREKAGKDKSTEEKFGYNDARDILNQLNSEGSDFTFGEIETDKYNQDYKEAGKLKAEVSVFMPDERGYTTRELEIPIDKNETRASFEEKLRDWQSRHSSPDTWEDEDFKSTNDTMNNAIREKASKKKEVEQDLPKATEIKTQGTSNRKEVSENIQAHILDFYDSPDDFVEQMDAMSWLPNNWKRGEQLAQDGSYEIYYDDQREFLNSLKINPKGKEFSDDKVFQMYNSLIGRESAKLYDRIKRNQFNQYKKDHPLTKMTFEDFKDMNKR